MSGFGWGRTVSLGLGLVGMVLLASGCAGEKMPKTYPVKGKVVLKNGKPMSGGDITFTSVTDPELRGYGVIGKDGTFTLGTIGHTSKGRSQLLTGAVEGEFIVNIRPTPGGGDPNNPPIGAGRAAFNLTKRYKVDPKENNELVVVVE